MKRLLCLLGLHDWRTTSIVRDCGCPWPTVEQDTGVVRAGLLETLCTATVTQRCKRCPDSRRLWARRLTPDNVPAWAHARTRGGEQ